LGKIHVVPPRCAAVRGTLEENREFAFSVGPKNVAAKRDAVAHLNGDAALDLDRIIFGGEQESS
jgi:hypothetical protein